MKCYALSHRTEIFHDLKRLNVLEEFFRVNYLVS